MSSHKINRRRVIAGTVAALAGASVAGSANAETVSPEMENLIAAYWQARQRYEAHQPDFNQAERAYMDWENKSAREFIAPIGNGSYMELDKFDRSEVAKEITENFQKRREQLQRILAGDKALRSALAGLRRKERTTIKASEAAIAKFEAAPIRAEFVKAEAIEKETCNAMYDARAAVLAFPATTLADFRAKAAFLRSIKIVEPAKEDGLYEAEFNELVGLAKSLFALIGQQA